MIRRWLREPLVHFLLAGAAVWMGFALRGEPADPASRTIALTRERQAGLAIGFERMMGRAPTDAELDRLVERFIREEVLYREALRLGIDRDDAVVRRRLATKMDELATAGAETERVDDARLEAWLASHPERFTEGAELSFEQVYFASESAARAARSQADPHGEPISLPREADGLARPELVERFGQQFARGIAQLEVRPGWQGPVASGFGWHLVRLTARRPGRLPPLAAIRDEVEADWRSATMVERRERAYRLLRDAYRIEVE